ncbi:large conductance mechanosensitive channel protein MscL [Candidatus Peregrinibacteria bacterium]|nr:large conductance mechanosensitive channel protein MscL [Candidatus Peregrinibacteria bacterium]
MKIKRISKEYKEFWKFVKEFKIISLAIAFIVGLAANDLIESFVQNIFMPLLDPLIPDGTWKTAVLEIGPFFISWGPFLSSLLNFLLIILVIYLVVRKLLRYSDLGK